MQEVRPSSELAALSWPDVPRGATVLVPAGSTEQHGPHLPLDTDTVIAVAVARALAAEMTGLRDSRPVIVAPALPYGASGEHQQFPGTVSLGREALQTVVIEAVRSLSIWAGRIIFLNAHGGNTAALAGAVSQLTGEGHRVSWVPCLSGAADAHAGRTETSLMLCLAPESVDMGRAVRGNTAALADLMPAMSAGGVAAVSASGILGNPAGATAAEGAELLRSAVSAVLGRLAGTADRHGCLQPAGAA